MVGSIDSRYADAGTDPPWPWADEKWAVFANFELDESALSVARRVCTGDRQHGPPLAPPSKGGEAWRNVRGGKSSLFLPQVFNRPPWPPLLKGGNFAQHSRREISARSSASFQQASGAAHHRDDFICHDILKWRFVANTRVQGRS